MGEHDLKPVLGPFGAPRPPLVNWLEERLREERRNLECRHAAICEALLLEIRAGAEDNERRAVAKDLSMTNGCGPPPLQSRVLPKDKPDPLDAAAADVAAATTAPSPTASGKTRTSANPPSSALRGHDKFADMNRFERIVLGSPFEVAFGVLILTNSVIMALEVQWSGVALGHAYTTGSDNVLRIKEDGINGWPNAKEAFFVLETFFGVVFTLEVILKICALRKMFLRSVWNLFDTVIVCFWLLSAANDLLVAFPVNPMVLRACRLVRLLRLLRLAKMTSMFDTLVLMISSVQASGAVLLWGVVLLLLCMTISALVLNSFLDASMDPSTTTLTTAARDDIYRLFGSYTRCMITMFEITMASWVGPCRLLVDHLGEGYAIFFLSYKCVVGFAVLKVITGVFLHETFRCASLDDDLMIQNRRRMRKKFKKKMMTFFDEANRMDADADSGAGEVSCEEFVAMIADDRVNTWLEAMDLRIRDVGAERIFAFLAGPDNELTREELCSGMARLRGAAQGLDFVTLLEIASPEIRMPKSRDVLRLTGDEQESPIMLRKDSHPSLPQKTGGARMSAPAADMQRAAVELLAAAADLRSALDWAAIAGAVPRGWAGGEIPAKESQSARSKTPTMAPWFRV